MHLKKLTLSIIFIFIFSNQLLSSDNTASNTYESINDRIIINDIPLSYNMDIVGSDSRFVYNLLDARVTIRNKDAIRHYIEYKFIWFDENGFQIAKDKSKWKKTYIDAKDTVILKALAVTSKIDSFKFYIRGIDEL